MNAATVGVSPAALLDAQRVAFRSHPYPSANERRSNLKKLERALFDRQDEIAKAIDIDFGGGPVYEVLFSEVFVSLNAIRHAKKHVKEWMADRPRPLDWPLQPARAWVMPQPLGVVGIIVPWNYPIFLSMAPLAGALAAGNRVMIKVSEFTPATSEATARLIGDTFPADHVTVVTAMRASDASLLRSRSITCCSPDRRPWAAR